MYDIGICDDGKELCGEMERMILNEAEEYGISADIKVWYSGEELRRALKTGESLDLLFLDVKILLFFGSSV